MAISTPVAAGTTILAPAATRASVTTATTVAFAAGDFAFATMATGIDRSFTVTDNAGVSNVWNVLHATAGRMNIAWCRIAGATPVGTVVTAAFTSGSTTANLQLFKSAGPYVSVTVDQSVRSAIDAASAATYDSGATAATSQAEELAVGAATMFSGTTISTVPAGWAIVTNDARLGTAARVLSSTGAQQFNGNLAGATSGRQAALATFILPSDGAPTAGYWGIPL